MARQKVPVHGDAVRPRTSPTAGSGASASASVGAPVVPETPDKRNADALFRAWAVSSLYKQAMVDMEVNGIEIQRRCVQSVLWW